jgi:hypothetical protein
MLTRCEAGVAPRESYAGQVHGHLYTAVSPLWQDRSPSYVMHKKWALLTLCRYTHQATIHRPWQAVELMLNYASRLPLHGTNGRARKVKD